MTLTFMPDLGVRNTLGLSPVHRLKAREKAAVITFRQDRGRARNRDLHNLPFAAPNFEC